MSAANGGCGAASNNIEFRLRDLRSSRHIDQLIGRQQQSVVVVTGVVIVMVAGKPSLPYQNNPESNGLYWLPIDLLCGFARSQLFPPQTKFPQLAGSFNLTTKVPLSLSPWLSLSRTISTTYPISEANNLLCDYLFCS